MKCFKLKKIVALYLFMILTISMCLNGVNAIALNDNSLISSELKNTTIEVKQSITKYFDSYEKGITALANNGYAKNLLSAVPKNKPLLENALKKAATSNKNITNAYIGYYNKDMMLLYPKQLLPNNYKPSERSWFINAVKNLDKISFSEIYCDISNGKQIISLAKAVKDGKTNKVIGTVGLDFCIDELINKIKEIKIGGTGFIVAVTNDGNTIISGNEAFYNRRQDNMELLQKATQHEYNSEFILETKSATYQAFSVRVEELGCTLFGLVPQSK